MNKTNIYHKTTTGCLSTQNPGDIFLEVIQQKKKNGADLYLF